jgi:hypothetical protein
MDMWDEEYFKIETKAYIEIPQDYAGEFQFGLVVGSLDGEIEEMNGKERFVFDWDGQDEIDEASGSGWMQLVRANEIKGLIKFHRGDRSTFKAKKAK